METTTYHIDFTTNITTNNPGDTTVEVVGRYKDGTVVSTGMAFMLGGWIGWRGEVVEPTIRHWDGGNHTFTGEATSLDEAINGLLDWVAEVVARG